MSKHWKIISASILFIFLLAVSIAVINTNNDHYPIKKISWNHLSDAQQSEVTTDWKDATVKKIKLEKKYSQFDDQFIGKDVYAITFKVSEQSLLGDITAYVTSDKKTFIGIGLRE